MRSPTINIQSRVPALNPNLAGRVSTNVGSTVTAIRTPGPRLNAGIAVRPQLPYAHYSPNLYPACSAADRDAGGECLDRPLVAAGGAGGAARRSKSGGSRGNGTPIVGLNARTIAGELVAELDGRLSDTQANELGRRHGLARIGFQNFPLIGATIGLFRITDGRSTETASRQFAAEAGVRSVQLNFRYLLQEQATAPSEGDPAQYALPKLRLPQAHTLARGANVRVAVIDSAIDIKHPELAGSIAESFDALGSNEGAHVHGTGIAGVIVAHARLMGSAPAAKLLAIRAFGQSRSGAESNSFVILKALDFAAAHGAQIVNMSFAGPKDALIERGIAATAARGITMIAAAGNAGAKSPPLYPAANPNVIAVSATDAQDRLFPASNRGNYVALAAPGVDIFLPAPDDKYQMASGTSFSAAFVSGIAALMLERNAALRPEELRAILAKTAHDLGSPGRDDLFGAGEADAYAAVRAAIPAPSAPVAASAPAKGDKKGDEKAPEQQETPVVRAINAPIETMASEKSGVNDTVRRGAQ